MNYWVIAVIIILAVGAFLYLKKLTKEERELKVKEWLIWAVTYAENHFKSGEGKLKLDWCYKQFCENMPNLAKFITFERFSQLVDEALVVMRNTIQDTML